MRRLRKRFGCLLLGALLLAAALLSGCSPITTDATALISPPKLTREQQAIEQAMEDALGGAQHTLKYPRQGDYRSSFVLHSFDGGVTRSALAFYSLTKDHVGTHVMLLSETGKQWHKVADLSGDGNEVDRVDFGDFDGTGGDELVVGWTSLSSTDLSLRVYALRGGKFETIYRDTYAEMLSVNMTSSQHSDLLLLKPGSSDKQAEAALVGVGNGGALGVVSEAPIDGTVTSYAGLYATTEDSLPAVLIDGYKSEHKSVMVTELLLWQNGRLTAPLYDASQKTASAATLRDVPIDCQDVDGDGRLEIPVPVELPGYEAVVSSNYNDKVWRVQWMSWTGGVLKSELTSVVNSTKGYMFIFPDSWLGSVQSITVRRVSGDADWAFYEWDAANHKTGKRLFDLYATTETELDQMLDNGGVDARLAESGGIVYAVKLAAESADSPLRLTADVVRTQFKLMD